MTSALVRTRPMPPREPQPTPPKTFAINSSRDMLEKLKREIERLAGSIIRQEVVDHGLNAAERFKISPDPIGKDGGAKLHEFSPTGESISYTAQASELWITDGSSLTPAAEILESTFQWWRKFIDEMSIS